MELGQVNVEVNLRKNRTRAFIPRIHPPSITLLAIRAFMFEPYIPELK